MVLLLVKVCLKSSI